MSEYVVENKHFDSIVSARKYAHGLVTKRKDEMIKKKSKETGVYIPINQVVTKNGHSRLLPVGKVKLDWLQIGNGYFVTGHQYYAYKIVDGKPVETRWGIDGKMYNLQPSGLIRNRFKE